ncbi:MAG: molybdopterin-dependent oxidoreductase [Acidobacteriota bacterium]|nr:molybdopterin-dependent oxidoreductase [Acidobacteriota bacterium]
MTTRRDFVRCAASALAALGIPDPLWALQDGEEPVSFTDYTDEFKVDARSANPTVRCYDLRTLASWATPNDDFYAFHQTSTPQVDPAAFRLRIGGFVERPRDLTLAEILARSDRRDEAVTLECSGNSTRPSRMAGLLSNGVWTGVPLAAVLSECGVKPEAREAVFLGADLEREKKWQAGNREFEAPHGRSVYIQDALHPDALLAFHLNGRPLPAKNGFPLRLLLPGWYGMTQVKWLTRIQVLDRRYEGQHQVRNYLSLRAVETPDGPLWLDQSISRTHLKSLVARITRRRDPSGWEYLFAGPAWGGQVPIDAVEIQIDGGAWQRARIEERRGPYAWLLWSFAASGLAVGTHTVVSRAIDADGRAQPTDEERRRRLASGREDNAQWLREFRVA